MGRSFHQAKTSRMPLVKTLKIFTFYSFTAITNFHHIPFTSPAHIPSTRFEQTQRFPETVRKTKESWRNKAAPIKAASPPPRRKVNKIAGGREYLAGFALLIRA